MRRAAEWLIACPAPDPDLRMELVAWGLALLCLADLVARVRWRRRA